MLYIISHILLCVALCVCRPENVLICEAKICSQLIKMLCYVKYSFIGHI